MIRRIGLELHFPGDPSPVSVASLYREGSGHISLRAFNDDKQSVVNTFSFSLRHDQGVVDKVRSATGNIAVYAYDPTDSSALFSGIIEPSAQQSSHQVVESLRLEAVDASHLLDEKIAASFEYPATIGAAPYKVCDPSDTAHSIFHQVVLSAGYLPIQIAATIGNTATVQHCAAKAGDETYREFLDGLLFEYGLVVDTDEAGRIITKRWTDTSGTYSDILDADDLSVVEPCTWERRYIKEDGVSVEWAETAVMDGALLYRDSLPVSSDGEFTGKPIAAGDYYPPDSDIEDVFQDFVERWLDKPYLERSTRLRNRDISLISTDSHEVLFTADDGVAQNAAEYESHRAKVRFRNTAAGTKSIYTFEIRGRALYRAAVRKTVAPDVAAKPREITTRFIFDAAAAGALANSLALDLVYGDFEYSFGLNRYIAPGTTVRLVNLKNNIDTDVLIQECDYDIGRPIYRYRAVALAEYADVPAVTTVSGGQAMWPYVFGSNAAITAGITKASIVLELGSQTITRSRTGSMTPSALSSRAIRQDQTPYLGRFVVALSHDNQTYQDAYTSSADESQISYPVPATMMVGAEEKYVTSIRVRLYAAGGTDTLLGERMASISLGAVAPVYWGPFEDAASWPTGGLLAGDYLLDTRSPASGGGLLRIWNGTAWVEYTGSMAGHPQAMAMAMTDLMVWAKLYGVTTIAAVNAIFQSVAASQAFIETLATVNVKILGTVRTGPNASESARVAIQDEVGVSSVTFGGTGNNDLSVTKSGEEAGTFAVKITKDVTRYPVGSTGPAGGKVFYTDPADGYVLEAMPSDQASGVWGASVVSGASGTAVKTGEANTDVATSGDAWQEYGSPKDIAGANVPALAVLSSSAVAHIDSAQKSLTYYRKVFYWEAYGTSVPISGLGTYPAMCPLLGGVAIVDTGTLKLRYYEWGNDTWNPIGAGLTVPAGIKKVTALNSTDIALYDEGNRTLRVYRCNGSDGSWVQIGNALTFTGSPGGVSIAALNSTTVAFASGEATTGGLRRLSWDGTNFAQIGSTMPLTYALSHTSLVKLNDDEVGHMVSSLQTYRWTGSQYEAVGNVQPLSDADFSVMGHLSANDMIIVGRNSIAPMKNVLRTYRWYGPRAARTAADLSYGGYSDWFLPSKDELALMRTNRVAIGGFGTGDYWSSSETGAGTAWAQNFGDGSQASAAKSDTKAVRAIRKFYIKDHFQWKKDGGAWSAEQEITAGAQYDLGATSGIKIAFGSHVGHVLNAQWTLIQGSMYGLSIKDGAGDEYVKASNGALLIKELQSMAGAVYPFSRTITGNTTLSPTDTHILVDTANAVTITLPTTFPVGKEITITRIVASANEITVARSGSELIEGATTFVTHEGRVASELDLSAVVLRKVTSTAWCFVGGEVSGSNSNGSWVKFSDGTGIMNCDRTVTSYPMPVTFPVAAVSIQNIIGARRMVNSAGGTVNEEPNARTMTGSAFYVYTTAPQAQGLMSVVVFFRWRA